MDKVSLATSKLVTLATPVFRFLGILKFEGRSVIYAITNYSQCTKSYFGNYILCSRIYKNLYVFLAKSNYFEWFLLTKCSIIGWWTHFFYVFSGLMSVHLPFWNMSQSRHMTSQKVDDSHDTYGDLPYWIYIMCSKFYSPSSFPLQQKKRKTDKQVQKDLLLLLFMQL